MSIRLIMVLISLKQQVGPRGVGCGVWERGSRRRDICIHITDSLSGTAETQHCKAIILQLKKTFKSIEIFSKTTPPKL